MTYILPYVHVIGLTNGVEFTIYACYRTLKKFIYVHGIGLIIYTCYLTHNIYMVQDSWQVYVHGIGLIRGLQMYIL